MSKKVKNTENFIIGYNQKKPIVADITYVESEKPQNIVVFCHGYKGYKDWGAWHLVAERFAKSGIVFLKFNFSHNGGTFEEPIDFPDLEAFGEDNFSKQLSDLNQVIDFIKTEKSPLPKIDVDGITLIGHSRGGGLACLMAKESSDIKKLITWAAVSDFKSRFPSGEDLEEWKRKGVYFVRNGRTQQDMPHYFQFFEDFERHEERFHILNAVSQLKIPYLIIHGHNDETVDESNAMDLKKAYSSANLEFIEKATHTFNTSQPWDTSILSNELKKATDRSIKFVKQA
jgi:dienelactone hydrolase